MEDYKARFAEFLLATGALKFGEFTLKSGRKSPYFINMGQFFEGGTMTSLGEFYADAINSKFKQDEYDIVYGIPYKGITLGAATVMTLRTKHGIDKPLLFHRKEAKTHGEATGEASQKDVLIGPVIKDGMKILMVDDVVTDGASKRDSMEVLGRFAKLQYKGLLIAVDRQEVGVDGKTSAIQQLAQETGMKTHSILTITEAADHLQRAGKIGDSEVKNLKDYLREYGTEEAKSWAERAR